MIVFNGMENVSTLKDVNSQSQLKEEDGAHVMIIPLKWRMVSNSNRYPLTVVKGTTNTYFHNGLYYGESIPTDSKVTTVGQWNSGGVASGGQIICKWNTTGGVLYLSVSGLYSGSLGPETFDVIQTSTFLSIETRTIEIDWKDLTDTIKAAYQPYTETDPNLELVKTGENPDGTGIYEMQLSGTGSGNFNTIISSDLCDSEGNIDSNTYDNDFTVDAPGISLGNLNSLYLDESNSAPGDVQVSALYADQTLNDVKSSFQEVSNWEGSGIATASEVLDLDNCTFKRVNSQSSNPSIDASVKGLSINTCTSDIYTKNMYIKIKIASMETKKDLEVTAEFKSAFKTEEPVASVGNSVSSTGHSSSGGGTAESNYQQSIIDNGNTLVPFDSVYMTSQDYNNFIASNGGIVCDAGVFAYGLDINGTSVYFTDLNISAEGSSMTVVQNSEFDATPILEKGSKIFGYVLAEDGETNPVFVGYVHSITKTLSANNQEIKYNCKDLRAYLDSYFTPAIYKYRPPHINSSSTPYSVNYILKDILVKCGISTGIIEAPTDITCPPIEFHFETLTSVLEWFTKYLGDYIYFIDRNGLLNFKKTTSGSLAKTYAIPTKGTPIASNYKVESFEPMCDMERSRSRIVVAGDYPLTEVIETTNWSLDEMGGDARYIPHKGFWKSVGRAYDINNKNYVAADGDIVYSPTMGKPYGHRYLAISYTGSGEVISSLASDPKASPFIEVAMGNFSPLDDDTGNPTNTEYTYSLTLVEGIQGRMLLVNTEDKPFLYARNTVKVRAKYAYRGLEPLITTVSTGYQGGIEVIKRPEFKKITAQYLSIDDTKLLKEYAQKIKEYYKPIYGGRLVIDGLITDINLLDKVTISGTNLTAIETDNLVIYGIQYNVGSKTTTLELSNKTFLDAPYFDLVRERSRSINETLVKIGQLENSELYKRN